MPTYDPKVGERLYLLFLDVGRRYGYPSVQNWANLPPPLQDVYSAVGTLFFEDMRIDFHINRKLWDEGKLLFDIFQANACKQYGQVPPSWDSQGPDAKNIFRDTASDFLADIGPTLPAPQAKDVDELRAALKKYGRHSPQCTTGQPCDPKICGFAEIERRFLIQ